ncbi:MAG: DUF1801 domain-containing protein [Bacillota bacterium]|nr:DUF1801 domain-containing protein [Bacillota bacterium]
MVDKLKEFRVFLNNIDDLEKRGKLENILLFISENFPQLNKEIKWNQPMFTHHGTYIIGFSTAKKHIAISPESVTLDKFQEDIKKAGYTSSKMIFRIKWTDKVDYDLLEKIIVFNIEDKKDYNKFWR